MTGLFVAPYTATYTFYVWGDDFVSLSLSTDDRPANLAVVATSVVDPLNPTPADGNEATRFGMAGLLGVGIG